MVDQQVMGGYNVIKMAKYINLIVGTALVVIVILSFASFGFLNPFAFILSCF